MMIIVLFQESKNLQMRRLRYSRSGFILSRGRRSSTHDLSSGREHSSEERMLFVCNMISPALDLAIELC
jgi:hypothetical protein